MAIAIGRSTDSASGEAGSGASQQSLHPPAMRVGQQERGGSGMVCSEQADATSAQDIAPRIAASAIKARFHWRRRVAIRQLRTKRYASGLIGLEAATLKHNG